MDALLQETLSAFGRLDILVNSAALDPKFDPQALAEMAKSGTVSGAFEDYPLKSWKAALDVNLTGMFLCCQAAVKPMLAQGKKGSIINICSTYGLVAPDQRIYQREGKQTSFKPIYYSVTKAGVLGLTRYLSSYYAGTEIRVNALTPGGIFNDHDEVFLKAYNTRTVMGRMANKDEMNGALTFPRLRCFLVHDRFEPRCGWWLDSLVRKNWINLYGDSRPYSCSWWFKKHPS